MQYPRLALSIPYLFEEGRAGRITLKYKTCFIANRLAHVE